MTDNPLQLLAAIKRFRVEYDDVREPCLLSNERITGYLKAAYRELESEPPWSDAVVSAIVWGAMARAITANQQENPDRARVCLNLFDRERMSL